VACAQGRVQGLVSNLTVQTVSSSEPTGSDIEDASSSKSDSEDNFDEPDLTEEISNLSGGGGGEMVVE